MTRRVLIIKLAAIGDVVMALPMVTALRAAHPAVRLDWMAGTTVAPLLARVEGIDEVIAVDETAMLAGSPLRKVLAVASAWQKVAGRRYDTVYVAHSDRRYRVLAMPLLAGERRWLGRQSAGRGIVPGRCHPDEYVRMVSGLDDQRARRRSSPRLRPFEAPQVARLLDAGNPDARPLVAITPGGARNAARDNPLRRWPLERYALLAQALDRAGCRVVITGDAHDAWTRAAFPSGSVIDLVGRTDLVQLVAAFQRCAAVVAHDSGPMHLARLAGVPVVALLGPTPPTMFFRPDEDVQVLWPGGALPCAPCYDGVEFAKCSDNLCMQLIDVDAVVEQVRAALGKDAEAGGFRVPPAAVSSSRTILRSGA